MNLHKRDMKHSTEELEHTSCKSSQKIKKTTQLNIVSNQGTPFLDQVLTIFLVCHCRQALPETTGWM